MDRTTKVEGVRKAWDKYKYVALVALTGAVLLLWPEGGGSDRAAESGSWDLTAQVRDVETEMEDILSKISGVGQVQVMLTADSDGQRQLARNQEESWEDSDGSSGSRSTETVVVDDGQGETPVVTRTWYPTYRGALVVCQGGDQAAVRLAVTEAVMALTGLPADCVTVAKWQ